MTPGNLIGNSNFYSRTVEKRDNIRELLEGKLGIKAVR
jgi:hypothetical protein